MDKELILKILQNIILEWVIVLKSGDMDGDHPVMPVEETVYVTLNPALASSGISQSDDPTIILAYDLVKEEIIKLDMKVEHYLRANFAGKFGNDVDMLHFAQENHPNTDEYNALYIDKIETYKYRVNKVLKVAQAEWNELHVYDLIEIANSEYEYDAEPMVDNENAKEDIIAVLVDLFLKRAERGYVSQVEHRLSHTKNILDVLEVTGEDIDSVRQKWLDIIREYRNKALKALDEEEKDAKEDHDNLGVEEIGAIKQMLRDLPEEIKHLEHLKSPNDILEFWPAILLPRPNQFELQK